MSICCCMMPRISVGNEMMDTNWNIVPDVLSIPIFRSGQVALIILLNALLLSSSLLSTQGIEANAVAGVNVAW